VGVVLTGAFVGVFTGVRVAVGLVVVLEEEAAAEVVCLTGVGVRAGMV
jgi:hypothetical protein